MRKTVLPQILSNSQPLNCSRGKKFSGIAILLCLLVAWASAHSQSAANEWIWMDGSTTFPGGGISGGVYGTLGTPSTGNLPGSRASAATWKDNNGNLWLFSGEVFSEYYNDVWRFNPATTEWTWMSGSNADVPGVIGGIGGVYGTQGTPAAGNTAGGRVGPVAWTDSSGKFWMFGGYGYDSTSKAGYLNDLWQLNPSTLQWTWMGGNSKVTCVQIIGVTQCGATGSLWNARHGGDREHPRRPRICDKLERQQWEPVALWRSGLRLHGRAALHERSLEVHAIVGCVDVGERHEHCEHEHRRPGGSLRKTRRNGGGNGNTPGGRSQAVTWTDAKGDLWLFGGYGLDANDAIGDLNDLWMFDVTKGQWAWMGGSSAFGGYGGASGVYGTWLTAAAGNVPGGRQGATGWTDSSGNLWVYGGLGMDAAGVFGELNDLWEYNPTTNHWAWMNGSSSITHQSAGAVRGIYRSTMRSWRCMAQSRYRMKRTRRGA